ncbi:MAG: carboxypeptidase regulatory-like domain-containing protein [Bacteroidota bacterium]|nr:carboxypeptidase regulatory-like domain-containing protein [Bacteroidota bacterium]MDP4234183.1 carboxypeptidase regulatory-like domain-containing protein [Bacteroidota bacterium]MDP4243751.1 carboxypeptidase regulatory-like domain-containing protein [Bacteroidota bacterium]MDP4287884.1 carboxypeptidase regulatory-like domain-containing protein [Bacteroidota bacterium]
MTYRINQYREVVIVALLAILFCGDSPSPGVLTLRPMLAPTGSIRGRVTFNGPLPQLATAKCITPEVCGRTHTYDRLLVGKDKGVRYSLIYLKNPPLGRTSPGQPRITQSNCSFQPHMIVAARGSSIIFQNDDPVLHNCHAYSFIGSDRSTAFNIAQPTKGQQSVEQLRKPGMLNIECDAGHTWMSAWVWVTDSPFAVVSDEHGEFSLDGIPPGTYTVVMWHEGWNTSGMQDGRAVFSAPTLQERQIVVTAGGASNADFLLQ